jgi:hypothetical protein
MQRVVEILLRSFLRRYPLPTRVSLFGFLARYAWLTDILEELRPELFPAKLELPPETAVDPLPPSLSAQLSLLLRSEIRGIQGYYQATEYLGPRGNGHLFGAIETVSKQPVVVKEFLLRETDFSKAEALYRQSSFQRLAGLQLADGRLQDFRLVQPIEAIADREACERCFLVTPEIDRAPTLRQQVGRLGALPAEQVQDLLSQVLQSLDFLHRQTFHLPSGALQLGVIHGNLSLDSLLWVESESQPYLYLCDLLLWEQYFDPQIPLGRSTQATAETIQIDLRAVGTVGYALLRGATSDSPPAMEASKSLPQPGLDPALRLILDGLQTSKFDSAETARRELMRLAQRSPTLLTPVAATISTETSHRPGWPLLLLGLLGLLAGGLLLLPRWRTTQAKPLAAAPVATCCLAEVSAIPAGEFRYTSVQAGTWWTVLQQRNLLQPGQGITKRLALSQPKLSLRYVPADSLEQVFAQVRSGAADFAVMPLVAPLPSDLSAQEIAYDGLVAVVSFSYANRKQGLPTALKGQLTLAQVQHLFTQSATQWDAFGGPPLPVRRYLANNPEVEALFEQRVLQGRALKTLPMVIQQPALELLRQVIRDFEEQSIGSIGITALSDMWGQCSVYPLALGQTPLKTVQPLVLSNGNAITPETDLCDRKGAYAPDPNRFTTGAYELSYPLWVVYPRDNRRSQMGQKFVELMRTVEGQQLLRAAGLVPLSGELGR